MRVLYHHRTQGEEPESIHIESIVAALRALGHEVRIVGPVDIEHREAATTAAVAEKPRTSSFWLMALSRHRPSWGRSARLSPDGT